MVVGMDNESCKSWDDAKKSALVAQIVSGKLSVKSACERHDLSAETIQDWVRVFRRTTLQAFDEHLRQAFLSQGADGAALGTAEYTGTLDDIPIADLIQTFQMGGKGGVITITRDGQHSQIWCDKGEIIDAESGPLRGEAAIYRILNFERGQVLADFHSEPRERTIDLPGSMLLLEAARRKDEGARLLADIGDLGRSYGRAAGAVAASRAERDVLAGCDGARTLREVLDGSEHGELETLTAIASLVERRQLLPHDAALALASAPMTTAITKDTPHNGVSFLPLVASQRAEPPPRRRSPVAFLAAGMAVGAVIWLLASTFPRAAPPVAKLPEAPATGAAQPALPSSFAIDSSVEPSHAELWLDDAPAGVGRLQRALPRDGRPHSLRVLADGHAPTTLLFVDAPPPAHIVLEKLDTPATGTALAPGASPHPSAPPASANASDGLAAAPSASPTADPSSPSPRVGTRRANAARAKRAAAGAGSARPLGERPALAGETTVPANEPSKTQSPRVQIIEDDVPVIQVIE